MNAYAVVGFLIAFGSCAFYSAYTVLESRRVAAKVMALQEADAASRRASDQPIPSVPAPGGRS